MVKSLKYWICGFLLLVLLAGSVCARADIIEIPMDLMLMPELNPAYYLSDSLYEDPSIRVEITEGRAFETDYLVVRVKIANATQLRSYVDRSEDGTYADRMAKAIHSVLTITGDDFRVNKRETRKYVIRQGKPVMVEKWRDQCYYDILMIDENGDFQILKRPTREEADAFVESHTIVNSFCFGPALVVDGELQPYPEGVWANGVGWNKPAQRLCVCQLGPLEYMIVATGGPDNPNCKGVTGEQFVQIILEEDNPVVAYNLDGGTAAWVVFRDQKINTFNRNPSHGKKPIGDVIYFASAWQEEETAEAEETPVP